ncbi:MAG: hypothetical protein GJ680_01135 [Alteromonadaceae bacterium]|nr:hypothetical protein [Alteromonadaceae bacterium]
MKILLLALVMVLSGCVSTAPEYSNTLEIIGSAAESAPDGVEGEYTFKIQAVGKPKRTVYLNTELDYRDQRNVTIALHPRLAKQLLEQHGADSETFFIGKSIRVNGEAKRAKIIFNSQGRPSGLYYYQTQIRLKDIDKIEILETAEN